MSRERNVFFVSVFQLFLNLFPLDWFELQVYSWLHHFGQKGEMQKLVKSQKAHTRLFGEWVVTLTKFGCY